MFKITPSIRVRRSPFYEATIREGVISFSVYNQMLMPTGFGDREAEYWRLLEGASLWDVAVERQVQITGPDAGRLVQILCTRNISQTAIGQGKYVALCDHEGILINDPILLKVDENRYWFSIADADILSWSRAIAAERGLNVDVVEPDISPMAVQGPKAEDVVAAIFGDWVRNLKYFRFRETRIEGIPVVVSRSGFSKQGGFELYLMDGTKGTQLWNIVREAGRPWDIGPGYPHPVEAIESGLLAFGDDTDDTTNPFEVGFDKYIDLDVPDDTIGIEALRRVYAKGPVRRQLGIIVDGENPVNTEANWYDLVMDNQKVGDMTCCVWSYRLKKNIGYALVFNHCAPGDRVEVVVGSERIAAKFTELPFC